MQQIINLDPQDDIASIRAKIEGAELSHVILVVPRAMQALGGDRAFQLLRRAAEDAGVEIGIVARESEIRERALDFGLPAFPTVAVAQYSRWRMAPLGGDLVQGSPRRNRAPAPEHLAPPQQGRLRPWIPVLIASVVGLCVLCSLGVLFVPAAQVKLAPAPQTLSISADILVDPSITQVNGETRSIPARRLFQELAGNSSLKTTAEKSIPNAPSTGTVIFSNLRTEGSQIPQGTIVKTSGGIPVRFTTVTTATLPSGVNSRVEVPVQAVGAGPSGNVKELAINTIEGSLSLSARVINTRPTASGSLRPVKVVTTDDKKKLEAALLQQLRQQAIGQLSTVLKPNEVLILESVLVDVDNSTYSHNVDDPADTLQLQISATAFGLAADRKDLENLTRSIVQKQIKSGYQLLANSIQVQAKGDKYQGIALRALLQGTAQATPVVDTGKVIQSIQGKALAEAESILTTSLNLAREPEIELTPMGWNRLPWLPFRIAVFVEIPSVSAP